MPCPAGLLWEDWYARASAGQREQALARAAEEGVVYAHQLPAPEGPGGPALPGLLTAVAEGAAPEPVRPVGAVEVADGELDEDQREAVARAVQTPDVALILGYPGGGKSRVLSEVLRQAARAGRRVLFTAASASAVDRALAGLSGEAGLSLVRLRGAKETAPLPAGVAKLCPAEQVRRCREEALPAARKAEAEAGAAVAALRKGEEAWPRLLALAGEWGPLAARLAEAECELAGVEAAGPEAPAGGEVARRYAEARAEVVRELAGLRAEAEQLEAGLRAREEERRGLELLAARREAARWWLPSSWGVRKQPDPGPRLAELARERGEAEGRRSALAERVREAEARERRLGEEEAEESAAWARREAASRREQAEARVESARQELGRVEASWRSAAATVEAPAERTVEAVEAARSAWSARLAKAGAEAEARRAWLAGLEQALPGLEAELAEGARVVAGPLSAFLAESGQARDGLGGFDLLVLDEAHFVGDADLLALAGCAKRAVLVGEPAPDLALAPPPRGMARAVRVSLFHRLWGRLHADLTGRAVRWRHRGGRLVGALRRVTAGAGSVHREPVYDRPDVELTIQAPAGGEPQVVEVSFPAGTALADAKAFIYRELEELAVEARGAAGPRWRECAERVELCLGEADGAESAVALEPGVAEQVVGGPEGWRTARLTFERSAGWDRARAESWAEERLGLRDSGRTAVLARNHRARPALARWLAELLHGGLGEPAGEPAGAGLPGPAVELVSVTGARREPAVWAAPPPRGGARGPRPGGAGLEVDLAASRGDALPADVRHALPRRGVVNLAEARAAVQALEGLVGDPSFRAASAAWQGRAGGAGGPSVALIGLLPEQAELLRLLVGRSALVANAGVPVEVGTPLQLAQRECLVALVSLTRSHTHRAVPFTEHPDDLLLALTRAAGRLVVFGDPGTLARRTQWHGALEHLDEITGPVEQALLTQLLGRWPEADVPARAPRPRESSSV